MTKEMTLAEKYKIIDQYRLQPQNIQYSYKTQDPAITFDDKPKREILIPLDIIRNNSSLEAIVLYLKDNERLKYSEIAKLLSRSQKTIWVTYKNARNKKVILEEKRTGFYIPLSIIASRNLSVLECIVFYLRTSLNTSFNDISSLLGKNYRTVWTVYKRALVKIDVSRKYE